jgi:glycine/D-amino acid oxidase-like deaminating enzyme
MIDLPHELSQTDYTSQKSQAREQILLNRQAIQFAADVAEEYGLSKEAFDISGKINAAATDKGTRHNISYSKHLTALGEPYELLDADQMYAVTGSRFYQSGVRTPGTAMLQPALYIRELASGLGNRVTIFENSPVIELTRQGAGWLAKTPAGLVTASKVILATNGHAESFGFFKRRLMHVILFASMSRALKPEEEIELGGDANWGITPSNSRGTSLRKITGTGGTRILTRNRMVYKPSMAVSETQVARMGRDHDQSFAKRFPNLTSVDQEYRWAGRLCLSLNGVSAFGEIEQGLFSACCQNGLGTARGTLMGIAAAELVAGTNPNIAKHFLAEDEPKKLPPFPIAEIGAKAVLRMGEFGARKEL